MLTLNLAIDMLMELARREKVSGIKPDEDLDIFLKVGVLRRISNAFEMFDVCCS